MIDISQNKLIKRGALLKVLELSDDGKPQVSNKELQYYITLRPHSRTASARKTPRRSRKSSATIASNQSSRASMTTNYGSSTKCATICKKCSDCSKGRPRHGTVVHELSLKQRISSFIVHLLHTYSMSSDGETHIRKRVDGASIMVSSSR